ncbi:PSME3-interacting protein [Benincasa hispida]|uniref:PSME3-interacting protein n=1 Tax=Benincasa hispida TaxID=102211 RepID=UPI001902373C|nr:PSME3-interacting protein [Benincasa hispida]
MEDESTRAIRLMNFVSEEQLDEAKKTRGERVEDGTAQRDRPLFEILKENKDKRDAEFNERFKHRPPKALDEDETEFLDKLEMSKREHERQMADAEEQELRSFQAAVAAQSILLNEVREITAPAPAAQEKASVRRETLVIRPPSMIIRVKPQAKKARIEPRNPEKAGSTTDTNSDTKADEPPESAKTLDTNSDRPLEAAAITGLVSYSDESEED